MLASANALKEAGNTAFAAGATVEAVHRYTEALAALEGAGDAPEAAALAATLHNNLAAAFLRAERPGDALAQAELALSIDTTLTKVGARGGEDSAGAPVAIEPASHF